MTAPCQRGAASSHKHEQNNNPGNRVTDSMQASREDIEKDVNSRLNGNMQDLEVDKSILENLLFQAKRGMQKEVNKREFFKSIVEQVEMENDQYADMRKEAFMKKAASMKIQQMIDSEMIPPYFRELNLRVLLKKVYKSKLVS